MANKNLIRSLQYRLMVQLDEFAACTTDAARKCVAEAIEDTTRQIREARG